METTNPNPNEPNDFVPKLWDVRNIIFLLMLIMNCIDLGSDLNAGIKYVNLNYENCEIKFHCQYPRAGVSEALGILLIVFGILGFLTALIGKFKEWRELKWIYKNCKSKKELELHEANLFKTATKWDIAPFIIEDATSIIINCFVAGMLGDTDNSISKALRFSCGTSIASMLFSFFNSWRKRLKFSPYIKCCDITWICHCFCWCGCFCIVIIGGLLTVLVVLVTSAKGYSEPLVHLNMNSTQECHSAYPDEDDFFTDGELVAIPEYVFRDCSGDQYVYAIECNATGIHNEYIDRDLKCKLEFEYDVKLNSSLLYNGECDNVYNDSLDFLCDFTISKGNCSVFTIVCNNAFLFYQGNAEMFACFDYCSFK